MAKKPQVTKVTNTSRGPRGVYLDGELIMLRPGQSAKADDWNKEWFKPSGSVQEIEDEDEGAEGLVDAINDAIDQLDGNDDEAWTNDGKPAVDAVSEIVGQVVTRAQIEEAAPERRRPDPEPE